jgi:hypothetical protein
MMSDDRFLPPLAALRRKLRALSALARDAGATPPERANAAALKKRIEQRLRDAGAPAGDWTDQAFRIGRRVKDLRKSGATGSADTDWTEHARRFGKAVGRGYKKWLSD